jgi:hypothetical protein
MDSYNKIFMILRETDLLNYDEKHELQLYLMNLEQQVKEQKEVNDKAIEYIKSKKCKYDGWKMTDQLYENEIKELLEILRGGSNG